MPGGLDDPHRAGAGHEAPAAGLHGDRYRVPPSRGAGVHGVHGGHHQRGRLEFGIGAAWNDEECEGYGIRLGTLTERFDRFAEACEVITGLLTQEVTTFDGRYYTLSEARNNPPGVQKPHPPICIGGGGERRTLPLVARFADHWNCPPDWSAPPGHVNTDGFRAKRDVLYEACAAIGRAPARS